MAAPAPRQDRVPLPLDAGVGPQPASSFRTRIVRLPSLDNDGWELESGEQRHAAAPTQFWIPSAADRNALTRGKAVKVIFLIEGLEEDGTTSVQGERMWLLVTGRRDGYYVGLLDNSPALVDGDDDFHLVRGAEIPFGPEHVIDIQDPPADYLAARLATPVARRWPPAYDDPTPPWAPG